MKKRRQNIIVLLVTVAFLAFLAYTSTPSEPWTPTWHENDRDAYGGFVTHELMQEFFPNEVKSEYRSLYEIFAVDERTKPGSLLLINNGIFLDENDGNALADYIAEGNTALIASGHFSGAFFDSLDIEAELGLTAAEEKILAVNNKVGLQYRLDGFPKKEYEVEAIGAPNYFMAEEGRNYVEVAENGKGQSVIRQYSIGEGRLYLAANPLMLSNYFVLDSAASPFVAGMFSLLPPDQPVTHVEYYQMGRMEAQTPFRYLLSQPELRWALYISLIGLVLFMIFEARRRQRIIPVIQPPRNSSIEFAETLGQLYFKTKGDHLNMARKRVNYLLEYIRLHYYLSTAEIDEEFTRALIERSRQPEERIRNLLQIVREVQEGHINENRFKTLEILLNKFYGIEESTSKPS